MSRTFTLTVINTRGTHKSIHGSLCRALASYDLIEPEGIDLVAAHLEAGTRGAYFGQSNRGSIVTLASQLH